MHITGLEAYTVAIPFTAPIFSAYGVSYPARVRTFIRVHTDVGLTGVGEAGVSATHHVAHDAQVQRFRTEIGPRIQGADPFDSRALLLRLGHSPESIAVELACWDLMGQAAGVPVYRLLGGNGARERVPVAAYSFFRGANQAGHGEVNSENIVAHVQGLIARHGFTSVKLKLGVYPPEEEAEIVMRVRAAIGPRVRLRIDPNGCWSLATAKRMLGRLEDADLEFVEEPIKYVPARVPYTTQAGVPSVDTAGLAALRRATSVPIAADGGYRIDLLWQIAREQAADLVLGDIQGALGIRGLHDFCTVAEVVNLPVVLHSGTELGVQQVAKLHVAAAHPEMHLAGDAIYPEYVDDVLSGGKLAVVDGHMAVPQTPGLGVTLDDAKLAEHEFTPERKQEFDAFWADTKARYNVPPAGHDLLVRHF